MHIYETASWWENAFENWKEDENQAKFYSLMQKYHDLVLFEVTGHDHLAGLRTHALNDSQDQYLNKVLFPGLTANSSTNPGFGVFEYDSDAQIVSKLQFTYINLDDTLNMPEDTTFDALPWFNVDLEKKFSLMDLSGDSIYSLV